MYTAEFVFSQALDVVSYYVFNKYVTRFKGNFQVRELDCWSQFVQLLLVSWPHCPNSKF